MYGLFKLNYNNNTGIDFTNLRRDKRPISDIDDTPDSDTRATRRIVTTKRQKYGGSSKRYTRRSSSKKYRRSGSKRYRRRSSSKRYRRSSCSKRHR